MNNLSFEFEGNIEDDSLKLKANNRDAKFASSFNMEEISGTSLILDNNFMDDAKNKSVGSFHEKGNSETHLSESDNQSQGNSSMISSRRGVKFEFDENKFK